MRNYYNSKPIDWVKEIQLDDGNWAKLVYTDENGYGDLPRLVVYTHYGYKVARWYSNNGIPKISQNQSYPRVINKI